MRTTIDIFDSNQNAIGELTIGADIIRGDDVLDHEVMYFCADIFTNDTDSDSVHIDVNVPLDLLSQYIPVLNRPAGSFSLTLIGDIEADDAFTVNEDEGHALTFGWGMAPPADMTVLAFPALYEGGLLTVAQPFEVLVLTKELRACLTGLFAAQ